MKKTKTGFIIFLFILQAIWIASALTSIDEIQTETIIISKSTVLESDFSVALQLEESQQFAPKPGDYFRPVIRKNYIYPFGTMIENIDITFLNPSIQKISKTLAIKPDPKNTLFTNAVSTQEFNAEDFTESYYYTIDAGIKNNQHVVYLNIYISPVSYSKESEKITIFEKVNIDIK